MRPIINWLLLLSAGGMLTAAELREGFDTEADVARWRYWKAGETSARVEYDAATGHAKPGSARFINNTRSALSFPIPAAPVAGGLYQFSCWIKTDSPGTGTAALRVAPTISRPGRSETVMALSVTGAVEPIAADWQYREYFYRFPATENYAGGRLTEILPNCILNNVSGNVWLDDVQFEKVEPQWVWSEDFLQPSSADAWTCYAPGMVEGDAAIAHIPVGYGDAGALKIVYGKGKSGYGATLKKGIPAKTFQDGRAQVLAAMVKVGRGASAMLAVEQFDVNGKLIDTAIAETPLAAGGDFRPAELPFALHPEAVTVRPWIFNAKEGEIVIDNLYFRPANAGEIRMLAMKQKAPLWAIVFPAELFGYLDSKAPEIKLATGRANYFFLMLAGDKKLTGDTVVEFELSSHVELLTAQYGTYGKEPLAVEELKTQTPNARRYRIINPYDWRSAMMQGQPNYYTGLLLAVRSDAAPGTPGVFKFELQSGTARGETRTLPIAILPAPAPAPEIEGFEIGCFGLNNIQVCDEAARRELLKSYMDSGIRAGTLHENQGFAAKLAAAVDFNAQILVHGPDYPGAYTSKVPGITLADGREDRSHAALGLVLTDPQLRAEYKKYLHNKLNLLPADRTPVALIDIEFWGNGASSQSCFHPATVAEFRKFAHIPESEPLDSRIILSRYRKQWSDFRNDLTVRLHRMTRDLLRELRPDAELRAYDYTLALDGKAQSFVDNIPTDTLAYDRADGAIDAHLISYYNYEGTDFLDHIDADARTLTKPVYAVPYITEALPAVQMPSWSYKHPSAPEIRMEILGLAASGGKGFCFFTAIAYDGERLNAINQGVNAVAKYADFYLKGKRIDEQMKLTGMSPSMRYRLHEYNGRKLLTLFNTGKSAQTVSYPGGSIEVKPEDFVQVEL